MRSWMKRSRRMPAWSRATSNVSTTESSGVPGGGAACGRGLRCMRGARGGRVPRIHPRRGPAKARCRTGARASHPHGGTRERGRSPRLRQAAFTTLPERMQRVHARARCTRPSIIARTSCRFGSCHLRVSDVRVADLVRLLTRLAAEIASKCHRFPRVRRRCSTPRAATASRRPLRRCRFRPPRNTRPDLDCRKLAAPARGRYHGGREKAARSSGGCERRGALRGRIPAARPRRPACAPARPRPQGVAVRLVIEAPSGAPASGARVRLVQQAGPRDAQAAADGEAGLDGSRPAPRRSS